MWLPLQNIEELRLMNRIEKAFKNKKAFIGFLTAGDPSLKKTEEYINILEKAGTDLIEIGIPFSDPIAEGPIIQNADLRALQSGTTINAIFNMVTNVRKISSIPLIFMTYINPVYNYGYRPFFEKCKQIGIDGIIIPDLPYEEKDEINQITSEFGIQLISIVSPTSQQRIEKIAKEAEGFLYVISSMGVTGLRSNIESDYPAMIGEIRKVTDIPIAVGFGINTPEQAEKICYYSDGIIVGSAIVKIIEESGNEASEKIFEYVSKMKMALL